MKFNAIVPALLACLVFPECVESYTRRTAYKGLHIGETLNLTFNHLTVFKDVDWTDKMAKAINATDLRYMCAGCPSFVKVASRTQKDNQWDLCVEDEYSEFSVSRIEDPWMCVTKNNMQTFHSGVFKFRIEFTEPYEAMESLTLVIVEGPEATKKSKYEGPVLFALQLATTIQIIGLFVQSYRFIRLLFARQDDEEREFVERFVHGRRFF
ncbi:unnamed protein product [Lymnaea stagnalis]|uniref:Uncharacterized protein n=1 Tax=Lymnaea stagnalis TaxID=6523 RepID=A0AAV2GWQ8_LYMST